MLLVLHSLPGPGCLRSPWSGVVRSFSQGHSDGHPLVAMPLTEPSLPPPHGGSSVFNISHDAAHYKTNNSSPTKKRATWLSLEGGAGGGGGGGSDVIYDTCLCRYAPTHATNSGGRTPGSKLPASPPPLPRPNGGGNPWPCTCVHGPNNSSRHAMNCNCGDLRSFCKSGPHALSSQQRACQHCPRTAPVQAPP